LRPISADIAADLRTGVTIVAGSTHDPEESWLMDAFDALRRSGRVVRLVVAPRDITRAARVARLAARRALVPARWSARRGQPDRSDWDVLIVDEYGWLPSFYDAADLVFVGGTLTPIGGHNVLEPAALGRTVIVGPDVHEIDATVRQLDVSGGIIRLPDRQVSSLVAACEALIDDPARRHSIGLAARDVTRRDGRASGRYHDVMLTALCAPGVHAPA
jgi:3-deoxy-D-manno-octulosonic-acid transferase